MKIILNKSEKEELELLHKSERDRRIADRIKAVLLRSEGWSQVEIAQALRISAETISKHLADYDKTKNLKPKNGGSDTRLSRHQITELTHHIESKTYTKVEDICAYVYKKYGKSFSISGMTSLLHREGFSYKHPKKTPAKFSVEKQEEFIESYIKLADELPSDEVIEFADGVHPTMATKVSYGWIRGGKDKLINATASKTRWNFFGSLNLDTMDLTINSYKTIDSNALENHFKTLSEKYPEAKKIHLILDQSGYNRSQQTREAASKYKIILHYLPPYSPNLNAIERLWKLMNEKCRNNRYFASAQEFRSAINNFFDKQWKKMQCSMRNRINDNFQVLKQAS